MPRRAAAWLMLLAFTISRNSMSRFRSIRGAEYSIGIHSDDLSWIIFADMSFA
jgi:hypothetical protein